MTVQRAIIIDPTDQTVTERFFDGPNIGLENMRKTIKAGFVSRVSLGPDIDLWIDDEGFLTESAEQRYFKVGIYEFPIAGVGLVCGLSGRGDSVSLSGRYPLLTIASNVRWLGDAKSLEVSIRHGVVRRPGTYIMDENGHMETMGEWREGAWH